MPVLSSGWCIVVSTYHKNPSRAGVRECNCRMPLPGLAGATRSATVPHAAILKPGAARAVSSVPGVSRIALIALVGNVVGDPFVDHVLQGLPESDGVLGRQVAASGLGK